MPGGKHEAKPAVDFGPVKLEGYRCRCGHEWMARNKGERPRVCPRCKTPNWDKPYQWRRTGKAAS